MKEENNGLDLLFAATFASRNKFYSWKFLLFLIVIVCDPWIAGNEWFQFKLNEKSIFHLVFLFFFLGELRERKKKMYDNSFSFNKQSLNIFWIKGLKYYDIDAFLLFYSRFLNKLILLLLKKFFEFWQVNVLRMRSNCGSFWLLINNLWDVYEGVSDLFYIFSFIILIFIVF